MRNESSMDGKRLVQLFKEACSLTGSEREAFVREIQAEDPALGAGLAELLAQQGPVPTEPDSFAKKLQEKYGSQADPHISLEGEAEDSDFASEVVKRLAGRGDAYGRYRLKGEVARGGQGAILRVWDEDLRRNLAMKVVLGKDESTGETPRVDSKTLGRFLEEAQVTGQLDHPGIVPVHELGLDSEGQVYFTMKLVKGQDLKAIFDLAHEGKEGWTQTRALNVMLKVCEAMAYAHSKGVIHRDLKPSNVMVGKYGEVYVMDWGLARVMGREDEKDIRIQPQMTTSGIRSERQDAGNTPDSPLITMDGDVVGTPAYMSPEQARGDLEAMGPHSDVYAVGAMLYHLIAGQMPYVPPGTRLNNYAIWYLVQKGPPDPLHQVATGIPAELVAICEKAMAREPRKRYADMSELAYDLSAFLENRVVTAYRTGALVELRKWVERNKALAGALVAGVLALVAGMTASWILKRRSDANAERATRKEREATDNFVLAETRRVEAEARADEVLRLSALQTLDDLVAEADRLWPAGPQNVQRYDAWLARAEKLVAELPDHETKLVELRARARPWTETEQTAWRANHPRGPELEKVRLHLAFHERQKAALESEEILVDPTPAEVGLDRDALPTDANGLNDLAWQLVDPERQEWGGEARGLVLARRAVALAADLPPAERANLRDTLAWALFAAGRFDEALEEEEYALEEAPAERKPAYEGAGERLEKAIEDEVAPESAEKRAAHVAELEARAAALEEEIATRGEWTFDDDQDRWWHSQLTKLVDGLRSFADPDTGLFSAGISPEHGWGVRRRRDFAAGLEERTVSGPEAAAAWAAAIARVTANPRYAGLDLTPQLGLVPLGPDPASGLEEFAHPETGGVPPRDASGELVLTEDMGLVFVLLPGGTFHMGAQNGDPNSPNYDPEAQSNEGAVHAVTLSPFFLSKYEMTQGQWLRFAGRNPSRDTPETYARFWNAAGLPGDLLHPVEQVSWTTCDVQCTRLGFALPSEAQWEYGARGGTSTVWWTGDARESLRGAANLADRYARDHSASGWPRIEEWLDDGNSSHAPVGTYAANGFGLYDVHGNVWEWCLDGYEGGFYARSSQTDPVTDPSGSSIRAKRGRVKRGGGFDSPAARARCAHRSYSTPVIDDPTVGLRPARTIAP